MTSVSLANALRVLTMDSVEHAGSGHPGMAMGMADVMTVLALKHFNWDPNNTDWFDRDRFVLSAGHGALLWYTTLYMWGALSLEDLKSYRCYGSKTPGHPERHHPKGTEITTGPLGQGIANAVGMALSESLLRGEFGEQLVDHYTYAIVGDGCLMEGVAQEAISLAGHWQLHHLIVLWDNNQVTIDGSVNLSQSDDVLKRFQASGWNTMSINGHDHDAIDKAILMAKSACQPTFIACRTHIGYGAPTKMGSCAAHGAPLGKQEVQKTRGALRWKWEEAFFVPEELRLAWQSSRIRSHELRQLWEDRFSKTPQETRERFGQILQAESSISPAVKSILDAQKEIYTEQHPKIATRSASGTLLSQLFPCTQLLPGAADLKDSTCTGGAQWDPFRPFVHYGIREHAMAAIMNGIAAHGGFIPCGGTFLAFSDYMRPAIRLSALMGLKVIYIMTHDSIGLGEDGPTHQPIEHLVSLRAIPNLTVLRPGDGVEVAECWELALSLPGPVMLCLSRQALPTFRTDVQEHNMCASGAYAVRNVTSPDVVLWASGSEVSLGLSIAKMLFERHNLVAEVYSVPWFNQVLERHPFPWKTFPARLHVSIEAGSTIGWSRITGPDGLNIGIDHFGASGSGAHLYEAFGFSCDAIVERIMGAMALLTHQEI